MSTNNDQEKKHSIKRAARDLFFHFGYSKTSMEDIAGQCGLAKPTLYYYYTNKEEIFNDVVVEEAQLFMDCVEKKLPQNIQADEKIAIFFHTIYQDLKLYAAEMAEVPEVLYDHSPHGHPIIEKINTIFLEKLRPLLRSGKNEGIFVFEDEEIVASTLVFMTDFLNLDWMQRFPEKMRDHVVETMIQIILNGLKRRK